MGWDREHLQSSLMVKNTETLGSICLLTFWGTVGGWSSKWVPRPLGPRVVWHDTGL